MSFYDIETAWKRIIALYTEQMQDLFMFSSLCYIFSMVGESQHQVDCMFVVCETVSL